MIRSARRRHLVVWCIWGPAILVALAIGLWSRPPLAVSDGPVPVEAPGADQEGQP